MDGNFSSYRFMNRSYCESSIDSSGAFSDCNSDRSGEFPVESQLAHRVLISSTVNSCSSDELVRNLIAGLKSESVEAQYQAAMELRLLAKNSMENRIKIGQSGAIRPLVSLTSTTEQQLQEHGVTAILNLSLCDENKDLLVGAGAIKALVRALKSGTSTTKENAANALLRLAQVDDHKVTIGRSGAIPPLVSLLETGTFRGKKDACTALYTLCSSKENKARAVQAGIMKPLLELMAEPDSGMVDKAACVMNKLVTIPKGVTALVEEDGIPVLAEGDCVSALLQICAESAVYRGMVTREGAIPPLVAFSQSGETNPSSRYLPLKYSSPPDYETFCRKPRARRPVPINQVTDRRFLNTFQAEDLLSLLRQPRPTADEGSQTRPRR
ncbi:unnamed protein product [Spirodela intermedia]|uniref:U-box domain-containing protein n=1 Tax=Spirodela intermedia TaxID=51605 RepID=A0A7I8IKK0_SPIIN|nr:unnamed protein product [Spirodela intermedia]CAA6657527.1 unnamed protein product [Spirodela intermedia]